MEATGALPAVEAGLGAIGSELSGGGGWWWVTVLDDDGEGEKSGQQRCAWPRTYNDLKRVHVTLTRRVVVALGMPNLINAA